MFNYDGKVALITGGSSGIGFGIAQALVERGARVALVAPDAGRLDAAVSRLTASGAQAIGIVLDVADGPSWPGAVARVEQSLGAVDLLVLNAAAQGGRQALQDTSWEEWRWVWDVNVNGMYHGLRACLPAMKRRGTPARVLITASISALMPRANVSAYGASKAAQLALAEALRLELAGSPIGVSVLCPAGVRTDIAVTMQRHAPGADAQTFAFMQPVLASGLDPLLVGRYTLDAVAAGRFHIFTHPEFAAQVLPRLDEIRTGFHDQRELAADFFGVAQ